MSTGPEDIGPVLWDLVDEVAECLSPPVGRVVHINPGLQIPHDDCCQGQVVGRVISITPITGDRTTSAGFPCGILFWQATLGIEVVRCVATVNDQGTPPMTTTMDSDGVQMLLDQVVVRETVRCSSHVRTIESWTPLTTLGGCGGGELRFTVRVQVCPCTECESPEEPLAGGETP